MGPFRSQNMGVGTLRGSRDITEMIDIRRYEDSSNLHVQGLL